MQRYSIFGTGFIPNGNLSPIIIKVELSAKSIENAIERAKLVANFSTIKECKEIAE